MTLPLAAAFGRLVVRASLAETEQQRVDLGRSGRGKIQTEFGLGMMTGRLGESPQGLQGFVHRRIAVSGKALAGRDVWHAPERVASWTPPR